ncbi:MAG: cob(I)yrinic acid a,c-diamide adenosyltransferase [Gemmatimonadales bacterium]|nr:cob(I)yrinic acid a,c-diamide adenosyltransferase [Gemmatimonadales bacterium]
MARIYTRSGDGGQTSLADGSRTSKSGPRVDLYGEVDELISCIGFCAARIGISETGSRESVVPEFQRFAASLKQELTGIQSRLFTLASVLADPVKSAAMVDSTEVPGPLLPDHLEKLIDSLEEDLPELTRFILPGGRPEAAGLHVARSICRRVERKAVALAEGEPVPEAALVYLNRLSDFLFTAARAVNDVVGIPDEPWRQDEGMDD